MIGIHNGSIIHVLVQLQYNIFPGEERSALTYLLPPETCHYPRATVPRSSQRPGAESCLENGTFLLQMSTNP